MAWKITGNLGIRSFQLFLRAELSSFATRLLFYQNSSVVRDIFYANSRYTDQCWSGC